MKPLAILLLCIVACSCTSVKYVTIPLTTPPEIYKPSNRNLTEKDLILEYRKAVMKINEWQLWYQINTNNLK